MICILIFQRYGGGLPFGWSKLLRGSAIPDYNKGGGGLDIAVLGCSTIWMSSRTGYVGFNPVRIIVRPGFRLVRMMARPKSQ
jgi:hypothetical protein